MSAANTFPLGCNAANPMNYLACCGVFELLARCDPPAEAAWRLTPPIACAFTTKLSEAQLLAVLLNTLSNPARWSFVKPRRGEEPTQIDVTFELEDSAPFIVSLDWWYETIESTGTIDQKSAWKMYAGQQTVEKIVGDMLAETQRLRASSHFTKIEQLLDVSAKMTGRFGFDPRSSRNALDVGFSPNDLGMPVLTYPFAELLAIFGLQTFFPGRTGRPGKLYSTRGWRGADDEDESAELGFVYHLWPRALPIALARRAAVVDGRPGAKTLLSVRARRKNYSNLTLAKLIQPKIKSQ